MMNDFFGGLSSLKYILQRNSVILKEIDNLESDHKKETTTTKITINVLNKFDFSYFLEENR